jgi:ribosomal protein S18 acetylase RimI-like enzyme
MTPPWRFTEHDDVPAAEGDGVDAGLDAFNHEAAPLHEVQRMSCFVRDAAGAVIGGAVGRSWGEACELQQIWVDNAHRGHGLGSELVRRFEALGRRRGCRTFYLETFSFQAPSLYRSLGYAVRLELHGFGHGIVKYTMVHEDEADAGMVGS